MPDPLLTGKPGRIDRVTVPPLTYLAIDGQGAPGGPAHVTAVSALYTIAYTARFAGKKLGHEQKVGPLEGLWWADDMAVFLTGTRDDWRWRMLIRAPDWLDAAAFDTQRTAALRKSPDLAEALRRVELMTVDEGDCLQALHLGPYADEGPLIARIHQTAASLDLPLRGQHHEIYLNDPSRTAPERLKTILRQPVGPA